MSGYEFIESDSATVAVNPFTDAVAKLLATWDDAQGRSLKSFTFTPAPDDLAKVKRQLSDAGRDVERSTVTRTDKTGSLTFYLVTPITRVHSPEAVARAEIRKEVRASAKASEAAKVEAGKVAAESAAAKVAAAKGK
jgi:hypothetical protein